MKGTTMRQILREVPDQAAWKLILEVNLASGTQRHRTVFTTMTYPRGLALSTDKFILKSLVLVVERLVRTTGIPMDPGRIPVGIDLRPIRHGKRSRLLLLHILNERLCSRMSLSPQ